MNRGAVVLLSGGLDSATVLAIACSMGMEITALSFAYGQNHSVELLMAKRTAASAGVSEHLVIQLDPGAFRGSSLTGGGTVNKAGNRRGIPSTYVPARNTIFLSIALGIAESRGAGNIFIGVNSVDYSGYPDCRREFILAFQKLANLATREAVQGNPAVIHAPLMDMTKAEIISKGLELGVDYGSTISCYDPDPRGNSCGLCDSCRLRLAAFRALGIKDPISYVR